MGCWSLSQHALGRRPGDRRTCSVLMGGNLLKHKDEMQISFCFVEMLMSFRPIYLKVDILFKW